MLWNCGSIIKHRCQLISTTYLTNSKKNCVCFAKKTLLRYCCKCYCCTVNILLLLFLTPKKTAKKTTWGTPDVCRVAPKRSKKSLAPLWVSPGFVGDWRWLAGSWAFHGLKMVLKSCQKEKKTTGLKVLHKFAKNSTWHWWFLLQKC